jgi:hypothetical protein
LLICREHSMSKMSYFGEDSAQKSGGGEDRGE